MYSLRVLARDSSMACFHQLTDYNFIHQFLQEICNASILRKKDAGCLTTIKCSEALEGPTSIRAPGPLVWFVQNISRSIDEGKSNNNLAF